MGADDERTFYLPNFGVEFIETPLMNLNAVLTEDSDGLGDRIDGLIDRGEAKIIASGSGKTTAGQRVRIEPIREFIYPTSWISANVVEKLTAKMLEDKTPYIFRAHPTAFAERNLGLVIEAEPQIINDHKTVTFNFSAELVEHLGDLTWGVREATSTQPHFGVMGFQSNFDVPAGGEVLAAVLTPRSSKDGSPLRNKVILVRVWADIAVGKFDSE